MRLTRFGWMLLVLACSAVGFAAALPLFEWFAAAWEFLTTFQDSDVAIGLIVAWAAIVALVLANVAVCSFMTNSMWIRGIINELVGTGLDLSDLLVYVPCLPGILTAVLLVVGAKILLRFLKVFNSIVERFTGIVGKMFSRVLSMEVITTSQENGLCGD